MFGGVLLPGDSLQEQLNEGLDTKNTFVGQYNQRYVATLMVHEDGGIKIRRNLIVPGIDDIVICRVLKSGIKSLVLSIIAVFRDGKIERLAAPISAEIYDTDVKTNITSDFRIYHQYGPGDLLKGRIISYGKSNVYARISTIGEGLGKL